MDRTDGSTEAAHVTTPGAVEDLYLDLLMRVLTRSGFPTSVRLLGSSQRLRHLPRRVVQRLLAEVGLQLVRPANAQMRSEGMDWPEDAETMIGWKRLENVRQCVVSVVKNDVPGDLIETGVWRGGTTILMRGALKAYGVTNRRVWVADSFQGLPPPDTVRYPDDRGGGFEKYSALAVSLEDVKANFARYGLLDDQVQFLPGWFRDTLPTAPIEQLALLRLDGDMYESTIVALESLYPKLSPGGYLIVDDYGAVAQCRKAVDDYRAKHRVHDPMVEVDWSGVYWQRSP